MAATSIVPPTIASHLSDPLVMEALLSSLIARVQTLEAVSRKNSSTSLNDLNTNGLHHVGDQGKVPVLNGHTTPLPRSSSFRSSLEDEEEFGVTKSATEIESARDVEVAKKILEIVASYGTREKGYGEEPWQAKELFLPTVLAFVKNGAPVKLVLPAFPFKSPNREKKVLGRLPDLGEEMAVMHLQHLCDSIRQEYEPGADCYITSDGLVYNGN